MVEREDFEVHLATCPECSGELAQYREVMTAVASLRDVLEEPSARFPERTVARVLEDDPRLWNVVRRAVHDRRIHVAAASLGGALVGAGAIALLWWRARRPAAPKAA